MSDAFALEISDNYDLVFNIVEQKAQGIIDNLSCVTDEQLLEIRRRAKDLGQIGWRIECAADAEILKRAKAQNGRGNKDVEGIGRVAAVMSAAQEIGVTPRTIYLNAQCHKVVSDLEESQNTENVFNILDKSLVIASLGAEKPVEALTQLVKNKEIDASYSARDAKRDVAAMKVKRSETPLPEGKFNVILADPPWRYDFGNSDNRIIENHYPTMEMEDICALDIPSIRADDCVLFLWTTSPKLFDSFEVVKAWGFRYVTCAVWDKEHIGMGYYFRQQHELLLVCKHGDLPVPEPENRPSSVIRSTRREHSQKPEEVYAILESMYPKSRKVELFCRSPREGWTAWGNEI